MNEVFNALVKEAQFTNEMLGAGATQIRKCNYAQKGIYFQAFTSLSTGLERIGKLCMMLDFYIDNAGKFPTPDHMKKEIGHDINKLYVRSVAISRERKISFYFPNKLDSEIYSNILTVLSSFAMGDRYSNIDTLVHNPKSGDPLQNWFNTVDLVIFDKYVSGRKKTIIAQNAYLAKTLLDGFMMVQHTSETGSDITDIEEGSYRTGLQEAVAPYRQLFVLQIIRFWVELLCSLQGDAMRVSNEEIPHFSEIFAIFFNPDEYFRGRKTWGKI